jgi:ABC-type multidrug transport system fused ATPase/permease subunit
MNDQNQNPIPDPSPAPEVQDWREQRRAEHLARHEAHLQRHRGRQYGWMGGVMLILLGFVFLLQNMGINFLTNWWALFILIPAFWAYVAAWDVYQDHGQLTRGAASSLILGLMLTLLSFVFLLNLAINMFWPLLLIAGGLALVLTSLLPS